ncbi:hypothetical protein IMG5_120410 [Ichthyophthirius multifiliis]|uniref:Uncharacterized protein n=1 Tax=Ichthyophthirius multifiliis TaxID=5932 RepID=G0QV02_ICHMU|nr:hypothetical protein IMG5_120410 [Ichthyophthirius multifiliis]EGR30956.1 hypothetical protein IMG5_120410 [Ichthyophthirius multifiliis]|eukprot:XP_004032543.1 hypothetical protein IMG5_120410 [Ichthyophthirius multifiliis]
MTFFGSPFNNTNSGINTDNDSENRRRLRLALQRFWDSKNNEIQQAIENGDARYCANWWKDQ